MRDRLIEAFRGMLAAPPSVELFSSLCDEIDGQPDPDPDVLAYLRGHLGRWPSSMRRRAPARWAARIAVGEPMPAAVLCDELVFEDARSLEVLPDACVGVRHLSLAYCEGVDLARLVGSARAPRTLDVRYTGMTDAQFASLIRGPRLSGLTELHAQGNALTAASAHALAEVTHIERLRLLDLRHNAVGSSGAYALASASCLGGLEVLRLHAEDVDGEGVAALAASRVLPRRVTSWWSEVTRLRERGAWETA